MSLLRHFAGDEGAVAATEYGIMLGLIVIVTFAAIVLLSQRVEAIFADLAAAEEW